MAFMFAYSMREKTHAHRRMKDNVPEDVKKRRLVQLIDLFKAKQLIKQKQEIGRPQLILLDKAGRDPGQLSGLTDGNKRAIIQQSDSENYMFGEFVVGMTVDAT